MRELSGTRQILLAGLFAASFALSAMAQTHYFQSGGTLHGAGYEGVNAMALGAGDNIWAVGTTFSESMDYDLYGNYGGLYFSGNISNGTAFVGLFRPGTHYSGVINAIFTTGIQRATSIVSDASGNVYIAGRFGGTVSTCQVNVAAVGGTDLYVISYGPQGGCRWGRSFVGSSFEYLSSNALALSSTGNLYLTGQFGTSADSVAATFYPEPFLTDPVFTASAAGQSAGFVIKLDTNGGYYGSTKIDGTCANTIDSSTITADAAGNVYVGFELAGAGLCNGAADQLEVIKFDSTLTNLWTKTISAANQSSLNLYALAASADGVVAVGGSAKATVNLYTGVPAATHTIGGGAGNNNGFLMRLDTDGNYLGSGTLYGAGASSVDALRFDAAGRLWYSAPFVDNDIDPTTANSHHSVAAVSQDAAIGVIKADGTFAFAGILKCLTADCGVDALSLAPTSYGSLVLAGTFLGQVDLDLGGSPTTFTAEGDQDAFIVTTQTDGIFEDGFD